MRGQLRIVSLPMNTRGILPVNEMFYSLQGEAHWTGTPAVFVRFQGCRVGCAFCDTKHTWLLDGSLQAPTEAMLEKTSDDATYARMWPLEIAANIRNRWPSARHVVLTGGEPADYDLLSLCELLARDGLSIQLETSGTAPLRVSDGTWVTVSPKIEMPGGLAVLPEVLGRANEIKHPTSTKHHLDQLQRLLACGWHSPDAEIWLQPLSQHPLATERCIEWCKHYGYRLSLQTHKYMMIR